MGERQDQPPPPELPLFDGGEADTVRATADDLRAAELPPAPGRDIGKIDTDRQKVTSEMMRSPTLAPDELRRELSDGGFARIDTLPDGFADILQRRTLQAGDVVGGRYKLLELLGGGAMGYVFVAENNAIGTRVAVKVLKPDLLANPE